MKLRRTFHCQASVLTCERQKEEWIMCVVLLALIDSVSKSASAIWMDGELCTAGFKGAILTAVCVNRPAHPPKK